MAFEIEALTAEQREQFAAKQIPDPLSPVLGILKPREWIFALPQKRPPSCSFQHLCCVAPDGCDRVAGLSNIAGLFRKQGFRLCGGDKRAMETDEVCDRPLETLGAHSC